MGAAQALVTGPALGDQALAWLEETDRVVRRRDAFLALVAERFPVVGDAATLGDGYRGQMPQLVSPYPGVLAGLTS